MKAVPHVSIIIPARNEEKYLPVCLEAIYRSAKNISQPFEIIVVLNRCTDQTEAIARCAGARIVFEDAKNLAKIRNAGGNAALGDILIFIDADSQMRPSMLPKILASLQNPIYVGGGTIMFPERYSLGIIMTFLFLLPYVVFDRIAGGLFFVRKKDFIAIHGFNEKFLSVEDIDFARRLKSHAKVSGRKFLILWRSWIITSTRKFDRFGDWYFLKNPREFLALLKGCNQELADKVWYDFKR